jgi:hypothetical protein
MTVKTTKRPPSIASMLDRLATIRDKKRAQAEVLSAIDAEYKALETEIIGRMQTEGADATSGKLATGSLSTSVVPQVDSWDLFYTFIHKHKYYHLLERRPATAAFREMLELKGEVPGVVPFTKTTLNLRSR